VGFTPSEIRTKILNLALAPNERKKRRFSRFWLFFRVFAPFEFENVKLRKSSQN
jgi:hypothetical protein